MTSTGSNSSSQHAEVDYSEDSDEEAFDPSDETASPKLLLDLIHNDSGEVQRRYRDRKYEQDPYRDLIRLDAQQA